MSQIREFLARYRAPLALLFLFAFFAIAFRDILLPFLVAILIAYVIDPIVDWAHERRVRDRQVPRGVAVLGVYAVVVTLISLFFALVGPQLGREVAGLARDFPQTIQEVRETHLPELNRKVDIFLSRSASVEDAIDGASEKVHALIDAAEERSFLAGSLPTEAERERFLAGKMSLKSADEELAPDRRLFELHEDEAGGWVVSLVHDDLRVQQSADGSYRIRARSALEDEAQARGGFDLVRVLDDSLADFAEASGRVLADALTLGQRVVGMLAGILLSTLVTFMVAAFISVDAPRIMQFITSLFPREDRNAFSHLLKELDRGLGGVIRGQLLICLVNGFLTWVGLALLGVNFAFVLAVIAGVLSLIPVFGTIISTIPCVLIGLTQSVMTGVLVLVWILFIHFIEGNILNPKIIGTAARIHPGLVIFALLAGEHMYGITGALLAVPIASIIQTVFLFFIHDRWQVPRDEAAAPATTPVTSEA